MSDTDINPCPPQDINVTVTGRGTPQPDNTSNDLLLRADNHTGCRRLRHIIDEPDLVYTHTLISNPWTTLVMPATYTIRLERSKLRVVAVGSRITNARPIHTGVSPYSTGELMG